MPGGLVIVAGFDGVVRALHQADGAQAWTFSARDHLYASPVQAADGTIIQASADGTVYALEPKTGRLRWTFDTPEPIRATPAIDGAGHIYFGNGEGKLYSVSSHGAFRWGYQCVTDERSDLNGSPAISAEAVVVAGDDGTIMRIPLDYPTSSAGRSDPRCTTLCSPRDRTNGARLYATSLFGKTLRRGPSTVRGHQPLTLVLSVSRDDRRVDASIDPSRLTVDVECHPPVAVAPNPTTAVSADRRFLTVIPSAPWAGPEGGTCVVRVSGRARLNVWSLGLKRLGGWRTVPFNETSRSFAEFGRKSTLAKTIGSSWPTQPGRLELRPSRSCQTDSRPFRSIVPSCNEIGCNSIHLPSRLR